MKFGRGLRAALANESEAQRAAYLDYKALKKLAGGGTCRSNKGEEGRAPGAHFWKQLRVPPRPGGGLGAACCGHPGRSETVVKPLSVWNPGRRPGMGMRARVGSAWGAQERLRPKTDAEHKEP